MIPRDKKRSTHGHFTVWIQYRYSGTSIQKSAKGLANFVHYNEVSLYRGSFSYILTVYTVEPRYKEQGAKKIIFTTCHSGKLKLAFTSLDVIWTSPKSFLTSRIDFTVLPLFELLKNNTCPSGKFKTEFTSQIAKSTSPGLSDTTFFALWGTSI